MRFHTWIKAQIDRTDSVGEFSKWVNSRKNFQQSSDIAVLRLYLDDKLKTEMLWRGFCSGYMEYFHLPNHQIPKDYKTIEDILPYLWWDNQWTSGSVIGLK